MLENQRSWDLMSAKNGSTSRKQRQAEGSNFVPPQPPPLPLISELQPTVVGQVFPIQLILPSNAVSRKGVSLSLFQIQSRS